MTEAIQLEAIGEFPFNFYVEKAIATEDTAEGTTEKELILEGVASTSNIDHDNERMSKEALHAMANVINEKSVPLRVEHSKSENAIIGSVFKAWIDDRNQLHIRARLDKSHPVSSILHSSMMENGKKMGFSVGGLVKRAVKEFSDSVGKLVKTFYDVELKEVSVTPRPANYDSWCISKSIATTEAEIEKSRGTAFYDEFLSANPQLDYLQAFAKSVPDEAWRKVGSPTINKNTMTNTETETKVKAETKTEETDATKAVTRGEFSALIKAFKMLVEKLDDDGAQDQHDPKAVKPDPEKVTAKAGEDAKDAVSPDKKKPEDESPAAKATGDDKTDETKEKASASDETDTKEKASDKTDDYKIETVERSIATLESLTKRIQGMKKADTETDSKETDKASETDEKDEATKAEDDKEETATKGMHPLDQFVATVTKTIEAMVDKMEKSGTNIIGFRKAIIDSIVNDSEAQAEIQKMMKIPGFKKSVSLGVPYMVTKEGKRFGLTATEVGTPTIEKSRSTDKAKSFKEVYKSDYSSIRETGE